MHVLGHHYESVYTHTIELSRAFQGLHKQIANGWIGKVQISMVAGERYEVSGTRVVETIEPAWHGTSVARRTPQLPKEGNCGPPSKQR